MLAAGPLAAQEGGTVTGRVTAAGTGAAIPSTQIYLEGTQIGTLSRDNGRYVILNVPPGDYNVVAERIGYGEARQSITVAAGQTVIADFEMQQAVLGLEEIVVTGEAGAARRREIGNTVSQIQLADIQEPMNTMDNLLQGRVTGMTIQPAAGMAGSGAQVRLRGNVSIQQSNMPLIYVDGVRVRSEPYEKNVPPVGYQGRSGNVTATPLNDIDPNSIDRIEVIKGAAATTLYGTEASAGVIQIFTKRGTRGDAQWTGQIDQGFTWLKEFGTRDSDVFGSELHPYMRLDPWIRNSCAFWTDSYEGFGQGVVDFPGCAHRQKYYLSARGGLENINYFIAGSWNEYNSVLPNDVEESFRIRGNFAFSPLNNLQLQWNTSVSLTDIQNTPGGNNAQGITLQAYRFNRNYVGGYIQERIDSVIQYDIDTGIDHFISGITATYSASPRFSHRLAVGYDRAEQENRQVRAFGYILAPNGIMSNEKFTAETWTFDYTGSYALELTDAWGSTLSWGGQAIEEETNSVTGYATDFPGPGEPTLSSGASKLSFEDRIRVINAGFFGQARFDFRDRLFLTAGLRVDGNSAFGENLGLEPYPKLSASYVISDEGFYPEGWGNMKLRAAYGQSGRAPGAFDAVRTWDPVALGNRPGFEPDNLGNPDLGPERTAEIEAGFDAALFDDRLAAEFTYYWQETDDALLPVSVAPSLGDWSAQLENVGKLKNTGIELTLNWQAVERRSWALELGGSVFTNNSEMLDIGGIPEFGVGGNAWIVEGQPVPVVRGRKLNADGTIQTQAIFGPNQPDLTVTQRLQLGFLDGFILSASGEYAAGHYITNGGFANAITRSVIWPFCDTPDGNASQLIADDNTDSLTPEHLFYCSFDDTNGDRYIFPADFWKLRHVTLQVPLGRWIPLGSSSSLTLSARDAIRWFTDDWDRWSGFDPEMLENEGADDFERSMTEHVPPTSLFTASLRVNW